LRNIRTQSIIIDKTLPLSRTLPSIDTLALHLLFFVPVLSSDRLCSRWGGGDGVLKWLRSQHVVHTHLTRRVWNESLRNKTCVCLQGLPTWEQKGCCHFYTFLTPSLRLLCYRAIHLSSWRSLASCAHQLCHRLDIRDFSDSFIY